MKALGEFNKSTRTVLYAHSLNQVSDVSDVQNALTHERAEKAQQKSVLFLDMYKLFRECSLLSKQYTQEHIDMPDTVMLFVESWYEFESIEEVEIRFVDRKLKIFGTLDYFTEHAGIDGLEEDTLMVDVGRADGPAIIADEREEFIVDGEILTKDEFLTDHRIKIINDVTE